MAELIIPNFVNTLAQANSAAAQVNDLRQQNALAGFYRDNAQGLMSGDQNALAGLAQYDPQAAFGLQRQQQQDAWQREDRQYQRGRDQRMDQRQQRQDERADQEWQFKIEEYAAQKSQQEREAEAQQIEDAVKMGLALPDAASWDAMMAQQAPDLVGAFDQRQAIANRYMDVATIMRGGSGKLGLTPLFGTDAEGNQVVMQIGEDGRAVRTELPEGVTGVDLGVQSRERAAGTAEGKARGEAAANLAGAAEKAQQAIANLTAIRNDPALSGITGMVQGRLPPMSQAGTDLNTRIQQAQGQAFLEAFESLKGGGAITEIEGQKAEQAMARLNRAQSTEAYQAALDELIGVLQGGARRAYERAGKAAPDMNDDDLLGKYGLR